jgi:periplasmic copper chaperone A
MARSHKGEAESGGEGRGMTTERSGRFLRAWLVLGALASTPAVAAVSVDGTWCQQSAAKARTAYVYMTVTDRGEPADLLIGAATPLAAAVDMIAPVARGHNLRLEPVRAIELDPHAPTILEPQGPHLRLRGLRFRLSPGSSFVMTLAFAREGKRDVTVHVLDESLVERMPTLPKGVKLN